MRETSTINAFDRQPRSGWNGIAPASTIDAALTLPTRPKQYNTNEAELNKEPPGDIDPTRRPCKRAGSTGVVTAR